MITDISHPDVETRMAILKTKAQEKDVDFSDEVYLYLATNIQNNIRELEGALNKLIAHQNLKNQKIDIKKTKEIDVYKRQVLDLFRQSMFLDYLCLFQQDRDLLCL